jgi:hypothetical protein
MEYVDLHYMSISIRPVVFMYESHHVAKFVDHDATSLKYKADGIDGQNWVSKEAYST